MTTSETTISTETEPTSTEPNPTVVVAGGTNTPDATVDHAGRLAALEERFTSTTAATEQRLTNVEGGLASLGETVKSGLEGLTGSISELTSKIGQGVASAAETVKEVVTPSEPTPDTTPVSKENWFFRGWGKSA